jgi:PH domain/SAM domain (Sterile alpha motif)
MDDERPSSVKSNGHPTAGNAFAKRMGNIPGGPRSLSVGSVATSSSNPVMNETLSVIEEHITDMHTPRQSLLGSGYHAHSESYASQRLSYINGHETDEEDGAHLTEREVRNWSPAQVAEHLEQLGADRAHCKVFQEQEITGDLILDMDRDTVLLKEFELGTLGRRLALFSKIQKFQNEIKGTQRSTQTPTSNRTGSMTSYSESLRDRVLSGGTVLPKIPSLNDETTPSPSQSQFVNRQRSQSTRTMDGPFESKHITRPSASSIRSVPPGHSRRHSSMDYASGPNTPVKQSMDIPAAIPRQQPSGHAKQNSFDRSWTMLSNGSTAVGEASQPSSGRILSPSGAMGSSTFLPVAPQAPEYGTTHSTAVDLDRGYFSSNENESRRFRHLLRKRDSGGAASGGAHTRAPSDGHSALRLSGVFKSMHTRTGSTDSVNSNKDDDQPKRNSLYATLRGKMSSIDGGIDAVTTSSPTSLGPDSPTSRASLMFSTRPSESKAQKRISGLRAISDAVTGGEKNKALTVNSNVGLSGDYRKEAFVQSPTRTDSSNQSIASKEDEKSLARPSTGVRPAKLARLPTAEGAVPAPKRKGKHATSAYIRGLEKKSPAEQLAGSDYSGWMRKKSKTLGKWHSRLFILRGRRLSYYYTEDDTEEKGLIDISYHRVLPANKDILTGFHATLTGAGHSPMASHGENGRRTLQTAAQLDMDTWREAVGQTAAGSDNSIFIFKLVPPRSGLSKVATVNFTQPKVHFFAVSSLQEGRNWMAALMKATIERDELRLVSSTYKEKTISLSKARELRIRPKEFQNEEEESRIKAVAEEDEKQAEGEKTEDIGETRTVASSTFSREVDAKEEGSDSWSLVNLEKSKDLKTDKELPTPPPATATATAVQ